MRYPVSLTVNGQRFDREVPARTLLVELLREGLGLTGTHVGCDSATCGACTVLLDGLPVKSCNLLAVQADGRSIVTIEGLAASATAGNLPEKDTLHALQEAFGQHQAVQCGFCTPGMILAAVPLLERHKPPARDEIRRALQGNICLCTGYQQILDAVESVTAAAQGEAEGGREPEQANERTP